MKAMKLLSFALALVLALFANTVSYAADVRSITDSILANNDFYKFFGVSPSREPWKSTVSTMWMSRYIGSFVGGQYYVKKKKKNGEVSGGEEMSFTTLSFNRQDLVGNEPFAETDLSFSVGRKLDDGWSYNDGDGGDELGATLVRRYFLGNGTFKTNVGIDLGYLAVNDARRLADDVFRASVELAWPNLVPEKSSTKAVPYVRLFHFDGVGNKLPDPGSFTYGGLRITQETGQRIGKGKEIEVILDARIGYTLAGVFGSRPGLAYQRYSLTVPIVSAKGLSLAPTVMYQSPGGSQPASYMGSKRFFYTVTLSRTFD